MIAFGMAFVVSAYPLSGSVAVRIPKRLCDVLGDSSNVVIIPKQDERGAYLEIRPLRL